MHKNTSTYTNINHKIPALCKPTLHLKSKHTKDHNFLHFYAKSSQPHLLNLAISPSRLDISKNRRNSKQFLPLTVLRKLTNSQSWEKRDTFHGHMDHLAVQYYRCGRRIDEFQRRKSVLRSGLFEISSAFLGVSNSS